MTTVLLGLFDGLHTGHISAVRALTAQPGRRIVYTFNSASVSTKGERGLLISDSEKRDRLLSLGADEVVSRDFAQVKDLSPEEFVKNIIRGELSADKTVCGENFRFGKGGSADSARLKELCAKLGIETLIVPTVYFGGEPVSTTRIRELISVGRIEEANSLLGYRYGFGGEVAHGNRIGSKIGIKTLNIPIDQKRAIPRFGVYASEVFVGGNSYAGVTNIGLRPTVGDLSEPVLETHLLDFGGEIYGERVRVELIGFIRDEKRFGSLEELRAAVAGDINRVKELRK